MSTGVQTPETPDKIPSVNTGIAVVTPITAVLKIIQKNYLNLNAGISS